MAMFNSYFDITRGYTSYLDEMELTTGGFHPASTLCIRKKYMENHPYFFRDFSPAPSSAPPTSAPARVCCDSTSPVKGRRRGGSFLKQKIPSLLRFLWDTLGDMLDLFLNEFKSFLDDIGSYWMMLDHF